MTVMGRSRRGPLPLDVASRRQPLSGRRSGRKPMQRWLLAILLVAPLLAGCASNDSDDDDGSGEVVTPTTGRTAFERVALPFNVTGDWSWTLEQGIFGILPGIGVFVDVEMPLTELGATVFDPEGPRAHLGLFLPDIPGCDWSAASLADECKV